MRIVDLIEKKRDKNSLTKEEIKYFLNEYLDGKVPDYQMSSFLMAVYFNDMTNEELLTFTLTMRDSGDIIEFSDVDKFLVDKHSTGGVGDKVTVKYDCEYNGVEGIILDVKATSGPKHSDIHIPEYTVMFPGIGNDNFKERELSPVLVN